MFLSKNEEFFVWNFIWIKDKKSVRNDTFNVSSPWPLLWFDTHLKRYGLLRPTKELDVELSKFHLLQKNISNHKLYKYTFNKN